MQVIERGLSDGWTGQEQYEEQANLFHVVDTPFFRNG
jgi:hypothetical protein